jgi:predicted ATPase
MLEEISLQRWKSFEDASVALGPLTLLVGANGSGKSNLLDAIRFLHGMAKGLALNDCLAGHSLWPGIRGGAKEVTFRGLPGFVVRAQWRVEDDQFQWTLAPEVEPRFILVNESLTQRRGRGAWETVFTTQQSEPVDARGRVHRGVSFASGSGFGVSGPPDSMLANLSAFLAADSVAMSLIPNRGTDAIREVLTGLSAISAFDPDLKAMRTLSNPQDAARLKPDASNLSAALWTLCRDAERKQDLIDWVSELCAPKVVDIQFSEAKEVGDVLAVLVEEGGTRITARSLSDGTLRFLALLTAVLSAEPGTVVLLEEIEDGLHPTRLHLLLELLQRTVTTRGIQVIATTHSPIALRELSPETLGDAVVFGRHPDAQGTVAKRLRDLPKFDELAATRGVEHLFTTGWLERSL